MFKIEIKVQYRDECDNVMISPVYDNESIYNNIKARILHIIEYEYEKQLLEVLNG